MLHFPYVDEIDAFNSMTFRIYLFFTRLEHFDDSFNYLSLATYKFTLIIPSDNLTRITYCWEIICHRQKQSYRGIPRRNILRKLHNPVTCVWL